MPDADSILNQTLATIAKEQQYHNYETKIKLYKSEGANYTSQLYSITLSAPEKDDLNLFAKVAVIGEKFRTLMTLEVFEIEIKFYTTLVPKYREIEKRFNFPGEVKLVLPKYYGGSTEYMKETLVLEELTVKGYQAFDRFKCFDWEYASKCLSVLARLHALSVAFLREEPELFPNRFQDPGKSDELKGFMENAVTNALEATAAEHKEKLAIFFKDNMNEETFMAYYNPKRKVVLNHGDFRPSNVLHKRDGNGNLEVVLVDFQIIQKSNPVVDLVYFLICGSDEEFRGQYKQKYFDHYYDEFSTTLKRLEIPPDEVYTKEDFDADVETLLPFGLILGVMALPIITVDAASAPKLDEGIDIDSFAIGTNKLFETRFNGLVKDYVKWGYLGSDHVYQPKATKRPCCCGII